MPVHQEAETSKTGQPNIFSAEESYPPILRSMASASGDVRGKGCQDKVASQIQEAKGSPTPGPQNYVESYTIGWICALQEELQTAKQMLDEKNFPRPQGMELAANDHNTYLFGRLGKHFVVIGCLPRGRMGSVSTASVATNMVRSFPNLKFALLVGIGGGAPTKKNDMRLGDVVVSTPCETHGGVVQLDFGAKLPNGLFRRTGHLNGVPDALLSATGILGARFEDPAEPDNIAKHMERMDRMPGYKKPEHDKFYVSSYEHEVAASDESEDDEDWTNETAKDSCHDCDDTKLKPRLARGNSNRIIKVHYGTIASSNQVMRDASLRDTHAKNRELRVLCFEMEAAGLMNSLPCIVIRGISDYADSHKNDDWKSYGALTAAAYARELLLVMEVQSVVALPSWAAVTEQLNQQLKEIKDGQKEHTHYTIAESQKAEDHRTMEKLKRLRDEIKTNEETSNSTYNNALHMEGTCEWLFYKQEFKAWVDTETRPVLWLNGKHGAGKTVLCAATIRHLSKADKLPREGERNCQESVNHRSKAIIRQFFSKDLHLPLSQQYANIAAQLVDALIGTNPPTVPTAIKRFLNVRQDTLEKREDLIRALLLELPLTFVFVDGLDEVEYASTSDQPQYPDHQPMDEVNKLVKFLMQQAYEMPGKVRVWLSSQPLPAIRQYVCASKWSSAVCEIQMTSDDTEKDIIRYFSDKIPISTEVGKMEFAKIFLRLTLQTDVEGSFLWATHMANEFHVAEDADDLMKLASNHLPMSMSDMYKRIMKRIMEKDPRLKDDAPLWRVVLSLLTFARRPMRLIEVLEAVAIYRTPNGRNIRSDRATRERILSCCLSLVRHTPETDFLRLSHSAVRTFLLNPPASPDLSEPLVDREVIQVCCLRYLMQPRYRFLLRKTGFNYYSLGDASGNVLSQRFLLYAAKYWYLHHETSKTELNESMKAAVCKFVKSENFRTVLQVQSLFIEGHFLLQFDPITDRGKHARQTLPNWMRESNPDLYRQYNSFQSEWCRLLQAGRSDSFRGELDRCFWAALGTSNFLCTKDERYRRYGDFEFNLRDSMWREGDGCHFHCLSSDGSLLWLAWIRPQEQEKSLCFEEWKIDGKNDPFLVRSTIISFSPSETAIERYMLPCSDTFHAIPVVPQKKSIVPPDGISIIENGSIIRVGRRLFKRSPLQTPGTHVEFRKLSGRLAKDSWELLRHRAPFTVVCRRRVFREEPDRTSLRREWARVERMRQIISKNEEARSRSRMDLPNPFASVPPSRIPPDVTRRWRSQFRSRMSDFSDDDSDQSSYSSSIDTESINSEIPDGDIALAEDSWSEGSFCSDVSSSDSISDQDTDGYSSEGTKNGLSFSSTKSESDESSIKSFSSGQGSLPESHEFASTASDQDDYSTSSSDHLSNEDDSSVDAQSSIPDSLEFALTESDQEEYNTDSSDDLNSEDDSSVDAILRAKPAPLQSNSGSRITIETQNWGVGCDSCNRLCPKKWYHCVKCKDFHLCSRCKRKGMWCLDVKHQLYKVVNQVPRMVVSRRNFSICQELAAFQTDSEGNETTAFRFKKKHAVFLHDSPPIIHDTYPLVVWAVTGSCLVFGDIAKNKYFEQKIKTASSKKAHPICVNLSFSPCGTILRMAVIDAVAEKSKPTKKPEAAKKTESVTEPLLCLNLHVLLLQLSSSQPARSPPKLLRTTSCRLDGSCARAFVSTIPFAFTWSKSDLYLTISDSYLHVYRISLPTVKGPKLTTKCPEDDTQVALDKCRQTEKTVSNFKILVPKEKILLPHSARHRSVQFFPAPADDNEAKARLVIGPSYDRHPSPPIGAYLEQEHLGSWVDLAEKRDNSGGKCGSRKQLADQFEEGWESGDCITVPLDAE